MVTLLLLLLLLPASSHAAAPPRPLETCTESLSLTRYPDSTALSHFSFTTRKLFSSSTPLINTQFESFSSSLGQLFAPLAVTSFDLVLTSGRWDFSQWGPSLAPQLDSGATGLTIRARLNDSATWVRLLRGMSGQTCSSLSKLESPEHYSVLDQTTYFASLASDFVCSENLMSWLERLPCNNHAGLGRAISPLHVVQSVYYSMGLQVRRQCVDLPACTSFVLQTIQTLSLVNGKLELSLLSEPCPLAESSTLHVNNLTLPLSSSSPPLPIPSPPPPMYVLATKQQRSSGDLSGKIHLALCNTHAHLPALVSAVETIPTFLRVRWRTLLATVPVRRVAKTQHPALILLSRAELPPQSCLNVSYSFDKEFMPLDWFPSDANRGFDLPPLVYSWVLRPRDGSSNATDDHILGSSDTLLVSLPLPDFSMPYNVITLSCTTFSFFLGGVINALTRVRDDPFGKEKPVKGGLRWLRERVLKRKSD